MPRIRYEKAAVKALAAMQPAKSAALVAAVERYAADPWARQNNVAPLIGHPGKARIRVGDWRAIVERDGDILTVWDVGPRGDIYKKKR
jgi:mRNA interferase RelE/StbE